LANTLKRKVVKIKTPTNRKHRKTNTVKYYKNSWTLYQNENWDKVANFLFLLAKKKYIYIYIICS